MEVLLENLFSPTLLFFVVGVLAVYLHTNFELPHPMPKVLSIYLLASIGLQAGFRLASEGATFSCLLTIGLGIAFAILIPIYLFFFLRKTVSTHDSGALAATYGAVSIVTFAATIDYLEHIQMPYENAVTVAVVLMEVVAIITAIILAKNFSSNDKEQASFFSLLSHSLQNDSIFLILASFVVGFLCGEANWLSIAPFSEDIFKGVLLFYLLEMGVLAARRASDLKKYSPWILSLGIILPLINGTLALLAGYFFRLPPGNTALLVTLASSSSYLAVPPACQIALPKSHPSLYLSLSLAITFPFNIIIGIPLFTEIISYTFPK